MIAKLFLKSALLTSFLLSGPLFAVDAPAVTFRGLAAEGQLEGIYFTNAKGEAQEFRASDYVRSEFYKARREGALEFYKLVPPEKKGEKPVRVVLGRVKWPDATGPFLILVSENNKRYRFSVAPDDESSFPMGSFRVINASDVRVKIRAGEKSTVVVPGKSITLKPKAPDAGKGTLFQVTADLDPSRLVYSNIWSGSQTTRTLVFIVNRANPNYPIGVKRLHESDLVLKYQREEEAREAEQRRP